MLSGVFYSLINKKIKMPGGGSERTATGKIPAKVLDVKKLKIRRIEMTYKLNIIEPWESGTESAINATIVKEVGEQFLLFIEIPIKFEGNDAQYFNCELRRSEVKDAFRSHIKGVYPINMVFDKNINNKDSELPLFSSYRGNFLSGELII
jgi:hypothetical protein